MALSLDSGIASDNQLNPKPISFPQGKKNVGQAVFAQYGCVSCHGADLKGKNGIAPALLFSPQTPDEVIISSVVSPSHTIALGFGQGNPEDAQTSGMPNLWEQMTVQELVHIVAYLKNSGQMTDE